MDDSLNPTVLSELVKPDDGVAVLGSSHSAMLVLKNIHELPFISRPKNTINIYRHPLKYAIDMFPEDWILYDNTGLKGQVADWTKEMIDPSFSTNGQINMSGLKRYQLSEWTNMTHLKNQITKYVFAIGYERNNLPNFIVNDNVLSNDLISHDPYTAQLLASNQVIPKVYGFGIAFPEKVTDPMGNVEESVGLWKFMKYVKRIISNIPY